MKNNTITINIDPNTKSLSAKLKAIGKHAQALADELDMIDASVWDGCGALREEKEFYADGELINRILYCNSCG